MQQPILLRLIRLCWCHEYLQQSLLIPLLQTITRAGKETHKPNPILTILHSHKATKSY